MRPEGFPERSLEEKIASFVWVKAFLVLSNLGVCGRREQQLPPFQGSDRKPVSPDLVLSVQRSALQRQSAQI